MCTKKKNLLSLVVALYIKDLYEVFSQLMKAANEWYNLGLALDIEFETLKEINSNESSSNKARLSEMMTHWLLSLLSCTHRGTFAMASEVKLSNKSISQMQLKGNTKVKKPSFITKGWLLLYFANVLSDQTYNLNNVSFFLSV